MVEQAQIPLGFFRSFYLWRIKSKIPNVWWTKANDALTREIKISIIENVEKC